MCFPMDFAEFLSLDDCFYKGKVSLWLRLKARPHNLQPKIFYSYKCYLNILLKKLTSSMKDKIIQNKKGSVKRKKSIGNIFQDEATPLKDKYFHMIIQSPISG